MVQQQNTRRAIAAKLGAVAFFMLMATLVKIVSATIPPGQIVFFRSFCALPVIVVWLALRRELATGLKTRNPTGHLWRGIIGTLGMSMGFAALGLLPLSEVKAIQYAQPVLVVIFASMFLGETVRIFRLTAVGLGMTGVLIIMWPRLTAFTDLGVDPYLALGAILAFGSALMAALAHVFVRKLTQTEPTPAIVFYFGVTASSLALLTIPFGWVMPTGTEFFLLVSAGLVGGVGQILLTSSYRYADASVVAPFEYASILLAIGIGYFVFAEVPTLVMLLGIALIVIAGLIIILRERRLGLERASGRKVVTPQG